MYDNIDQFNANLANQVSLWVALHAALPQEISKCNTNFKGKVKRNAFFTQRAVVLVEGASTYPYVGEA